MSGDPQVEFTVDYDKRKELQSVAHDIAMLVSCFRWGMLADMQARGTPSIVSENG